MSEPLRWLEDPSTEASLSEALRAASKAPPMPPAIEARLEEYASNLLASGVAAKGATTALLAKASATLGGSAVKALLAVSVMGAAGTAGYLAVDRQLEGRAPSAVASVGAPSPHRDEVEPARPNERYSQAESPRSVAPDSSGPVASRVSSIGESTRTITTTQSGAEANSPATASDVTSIAHEAKLLEVARATLAHNPAKAYELAERHRRIHPDGQLAAERELIVIDALLRMGRRAEAERRANLQLRGAPENIYTRRLRQLLAE